MLGWLYLGQDRLDLLVWADHEGTPFGAHVFLAVHAFFSPNAIGLDDAFGFITQKGKGEAIFVNKPSVTPGGVDTDPKDLRFSLELLPIIPQSASLGRATGGIVFGVKVKNQSLALKILK